MKQLAISYGNLESTQSKLWSLTRIIKNLLSANNKDELIDKLFFLLKKILFYKELLYFYYNGNEFILKKKSGFTYIEGEKFEDFLTSYFNKQKNKDNSQFYNIKQDIINNIGNNKIFIRLNLIFIPLNITTNNRSFIIIKVEEEMFQEDDKKILYILKDQLVLLLNNFNLLEDIRHQAITDCGTNLFNQRYFYKMLDNLYKNALKNNDSLSVIIFDIDDFKILNDKYGHLFGDKVLREISDLLKKNVRKNDILARYGGEEFGLILPLTDKNVALKIAERMRIVIENKDFINFSGEVVKTSISGGIATIPDCQVENVLQLVQKADDALYRSKGEGKNKVYYSD